VVWALLEALSQPVQRPWGVPVQAQLARQSRRRLPVAEPHEFTVDTGRGYEIAGRASVDHDNGPAKLNIMLSRADGQPFQYGQTEYDITLSIDEDLT
jgi:hypothetical protein